MNKGEKMSPVGIGCKLDKVGADVVLSSLKARCGAEQEGLVVGSVILAVDHVSVKGKELSDVRQMIMGPTGTLVSISFRHPFRHEILLRQVRRGSMAEPTRAPTEPEKTRFPAPSSTSSEPPATTPPHTHPPRTPPPPSSAEEAKMEHVRQRLEQVLGDLNDSLSSRRLHNSPEKLPVDPGNGGSITRESCHEKGPLSEQISTLSSALSVSEETAVQNSHQIGRLQLLLEQKQMAYERLKSVSDSCNVERDHLSQQISTLSHKLAVSESTAAQSKQENLRLHLLLDEKQLAHSEMSVRLKSLSDDCFRLIRSNDFLQSINAKAKEEVETLKRERGATQHHGSESANSDAHVVNNLRQHRRQLQEQIGTARERVQQGVEAMRRLMLEAQADLSALSEALVRDKHSQKQSEIAIRAELEGARQQDRVAWAVQAREYAERSKAQEAEMDRLTDSLRDALRDRQLQKEILSELSLEVQRLKSEIERAHKVAPSRPASSPPIPLLCLPPCIRDSFSAVVLPQCERGRLGPPHAIDRSVSVDDSVLPMP